VYADFAENWLALPVVKGRKTPNERFAGALDTYCIEALMQDGKALQAGTSHFLGQNFAKAFDVKFANKEGKLDYVWATSWGVSTRLIGALIMAHSDDAGLVLPPKLAPIQVVVVPIYKHDEELEKISAYVKELSAELKAKDISIKFDNRDTQRPGFKFAEYELKGVPLRVAIGSRDMQNGTVELARRDNKTKETVNQEGLANHIEQLLEEIQANIYKKAFDFRSNNITKVDSYDEFKRLLDEKPGFLSAHWDGTPETEQKIKDETKATIRCIPLDNEQEDGKCILTGKPSTQRVLFARAY
ncbi:MAG: proline--tRNA ligase, partial [Sphingobacteriales bacterium]